MKTVPPIRRFLPMWLAGLAVALIGAAQTAQPVSAQQALFVRPAVQPLDGDPFELFFAGSWIYYFEPATPEPQLWVDGQVIEVGVAAFPPLILPPITDYAFGVQVPGLPAGEYEVRLVFGEVGTGQPPIDVYTLAVEYRRIDVEVLTQPLVAGETAKIRISGLTHCPNTTESPLVVGGDIFVPAAIDCPADPPQPFEQFFETPPLAAGEYRIWVVPAGSEPYVDDYAYGSSRLTVSPRPTLAGGRFDLEVAWSDFLGGTGIGRPASPPSEESALFWFFGVNNWELMVKVLDGCSINDHYWVFSAASTNVAYDLTIRDALGSPDWTFSNPLGVQSPAEADILAFPCQPEVPPLAAPSLSPPERAHGTAAAVVGQSSGFPWLGPAVFEPALPDDTRPTTLHLAGTWPAGELPLPAIESVAIDADAHEVQIRLGGPECGVILCPAGPDYALSADLGVLEQGPWNVEVVAEGLGGAQPLLDRDFQVYPGFEVVVPDFQQVDIYPVQLVVRGIAPCPTLEVESITDEEIGLRVGICSIGIPPGAEPFEFPLSLDLEAGSYRVVLRGLYGDEVLYETELEVVAVPIPLGPGGRYVASVTWTDFEGLQGRGLPAQPPSEDSALFWFFGPKNWELMLKVLNACDINGHVWVFGAATTTVGYELTVVDTVTGAEWTYENPRGHASDAITDIQAFVCD